MNETTTVKVCPRCQETAGMTLSSGARLCFGCRYEWTGDGVPATLTDPPFVPAPDPDDVLGPPDEVVAARDAQARLDALIGTEVELEGGQRALIVSFVDDDLVEVDVYYENGDTHRDVVEYNDVVRSIVAPEVVPEVADDVQRAMALTFATVAAMTLEAGLATIEMDDDRRTLAIPPTGWLPRDPDAWMAVEQGVAYAIAALVYSLELPTETVAALAADILDNANNDTKGGN